MAKSTTAPADQKLGDTLPEIRLPDTGGTERSLGENLGAKRGAVIVFWSGACSHCQRYDGWLSAFAERRPELALVVVASRQHEDADAVARAQGERSLPFPILVDADRAVARAYRVEQTPRAFLLDAGRRLLYRGAIDNFTYPRDPGHEPYLDDAIDDFLAGRPVRRGETPSYGCPIESVYYRA